MNPEELECIYEDIRRLNQEVYDLKEKIKNIEHILSEMMFREREKKYNEEVKKQT